ncbi:hypothetical protein [Amycolatopsis sp.]|jgi:hypothetical protein|uniref:hypothetical protein n=1 Tax=Amycolatopsis sp. TaxID=37632 RepID=UPI002DFFC299|nr:hypothetical protein [Amycolatopsis sp.]
MDLSVKLCVVAAAVLLLRVILSVVNTNAIVAKTAARLDVSLELGRRIADGVGSVILALLLVVLWVFSAWKVRAGRPWAPAIVCGISTLQVLSAVYDLVDPGVYFTVVMYFEIGVPGVLEVLLRLVTVVLATGALVFTYKGLLLALRAHRKTATRA